MPETYGLPEPEPTRTEQATYITKEVLAGQSVLRTVGLYLVLGAAIVVMLAADGAIGILAGGLGIIALLLLSFSDGRLS